MIVFVTEMSSLRRFFELWQPSYAWTISAMATDIDALRAKDLFQGLPNEALTHLAASSVRRSLSADEPLLGAEQIDDHDVYLVLEGRISVYKAGSAKAPVVLGDIRPGGLFGEFAAISGRPGWASAKAVTATDVLIIRRDVFLSMLHQHPSVALKLLQNLIDLIHRLDDRIVAHSEVDKALDDTVRRLFLSTI
jgi:CRP-like cAMP-binding protein